MAVTAALVHLIKVIVPPRLPTSSECCILNQPFFFRKLDFQDFIICQFSVSPHAWFVRKRESNESTGYVNHKAHCETKRTRMNTLVCSTIVFN